MKVAIVRLGEVCYREVEVQGLISAHRYTALARHGCARETGATAGKLQIRVVGFGLLGMGFCAGRVDALHAVKA